MKTTEKYISFLVPIIKEIKKTKINGEEITKTIAYKLKFFDSVRLVASLLLKIVENFSEGIYKTKCKYKAW